MNRILIDASVIIAWLLDEQRPGWVDRLLHDARSGNVALVAPALLWLEVGNVLVFARTLTDDQATDGMLRLDALGLEPIDVQRPLQLQALLLARETGLTMYDAIYLAVAVASGMPLATLDRSLDAAAAVRGLSHGSGPTRVAEQAARYAQPVDAVSLAAIGAALAGLRSRYVP